MAERGRVGVARAAGRVVGRTLGRPEVRARLDRARLRRARIAGFFWFLGFVWIGVLLPGAAQRLFGVQGRTAAIAGGIAGAVVGLWWNAEVIRRAKGQAPRSRTASLLFVGWLIALGAIIALTAATT